MTVNPLASPPMPDPPVGKVDTSDMAASQKRTTVSLDRERILRHLWKHHLTGATQDETAAALNMKTQTASARFFELREIGYIERLDRTRETRSHAQARVHRITEAGRAILQQLDDQRRAA